MNHRLGPYELNSIITGDARELSKAIPDESVDIIFTSPPYNVGLDYGVYKDNLEDDDFWQFQKDWLGEAFRIAKLGARLYAIISDKMIWEFRELGIMEGWRLHQPLVWCKPNFAGGTRRINKDWVTAVEWCLLFHKDKRTPMQSGGVVTTHNWIVEASTQSNFNGVKKKVHPAQLPLRVAYSWLSRTPGEIIYDPFVGSGTTVQAAKMLNRQYLAFEIDHETADLARQRVANTQPPLPLKWAEQMPLLGKELINES